MKADVDPPITGVGPFESIEGVGIAEVIIIGCNTEEILKDNQHNYEKCLSAGYLESALEALCWRIRDIRKKYSKLRHLAIFSNHRREAGANISHVNWQLIVSPMIPTGVERELKHGRHYFEEYFGRCCFCDMIQAEIAHTEDLKGKKPEDARKKESEIERGEILGNRIISKNEDFIVLAPYASRSPFEVWIMPMKHVSRIEDSLIEDRGSNQNNRPVIQRLANILSETLGNLYEKLKDPGYSMIIQNAPYAPKGYEHLYSHYHWRIIIETHKLATPAGYEHLTGIWSNSIAPETAAKELYIGVS
jgi:UDPglucose--hexose-1-phosphate uridylyltransferase